MFLTSSISRPEIALHKKSFMKVENAENIGASEALNRKPYQRLTAL